MISLLRAVLAAASVFVCTGVTAPERIDYQLTPVRAHGALIGVDIDVRFRGDADGETTLDLPGEWGGEEHLWTGIENLRALSGATLQTTDRADRRSLVHRPHARIHLRYRLIQDRPGAPSAEHGNAYRPLVQPGYFHLIGNAALIAPELDPSTPVRISTRAMPRGWAFASDLEHANTTLASVGDSVTVGGDFRIVRASDLRVAIRGDVGFDDQAFTNQIAGILAAERQYWGDASSPYLVTVLELEAPNPGWLSIGGTNLGDSFAFFATPNADADTVLGILAHEVMHNWSPAGIGGTPDQDEALHYWLSEGFTDFLTLRVLVRSGLITPEQFAQRFNALLRAYAVSPVRTAPNTRILSDFWNDRAVERLPYQRGQLLATLWDARLRAGGHDFDDVVFAMRARANAGEGDAITLFPRVMQSFGVDVTPDLAAVVERGDAILLPADLFAPCGAIVTRQAPVFDRGFDLAATEADANIIHGVDPQLPAYAAGLRDGMVLLRRAGGEIGNAEMEIAYVVRDGDQERTIRYLPAGRGSFTLQRFDLAAELEGERRAQCLRVFGGA